jgi:hypothetical protein
MSRKSLSILFYILLYIPVLLFIEYNFSFDSLRISLESSHFEGNFQLHYDIFRQFNKNDIIEKDYRSIQEGDKFSVTLPPVFVRKFRIDPGESPGKIHLKEICLSNTVFPERSVCLKGQQIIENFNIYPHGTTSDFRVNEDGFAEIQSTGNDPSIITSSRFFGRIWEISHTVNFTAHILALIVFSLLFFGGNRYTKYISQNLSWTSVSKRWKQFLQLSITLIALFLIGFVFFNATSKIRNNTPPFQGADELAYTGSYYSWENDIPCGSIPESFVNLNAATEFLPFQSKEHIDSTRLTRILEAGRDSADLVSFKNTSCGYNKFYILLPNLIHHMVIGKSTGADYPIRFLDSLRKTYSLSAIVYWLLSFVLLIWGSPLIAMGERTTLTLRLAGILGLVHMMFLPQNIWISSIVTPDSIIIAGGSFLILSALFRIRIFSDVFLWLSMVAMSVKWAYLIPFAVVPLFHYACIFWKALPRQTRLKQIGRFSSKKGWFGIFLIMMLIPPMGYLSIRFIYFAYCKGVDCFVLKTASLFRDFGLFLQQLKFMIMEIKVLAFPHAFHVDSAFGLFGWLDTPITGSSSMIYMMPLLFSIAYGIGCFLLCSLKRLTGGNSNYRETGIRIYALLAIIFWLVSFMMIYLLLVRLKVWCGPGMDFGCGYQKRYELPLYSFMPIIGFFLFFHFSIQLISDPKRAKSVLIILFILILGFQFKAISLTIQTQVETIANRYFENAEIQMQYQHFLSGTRE